MCLVFIVWFGEWLRYCNFFPSYLFSSVWSFCSLLLKFFPNFRKYFLPQKSGITYLRPKTLLPVLICCYWCYHCFSENLSWLFHCSYWSSFFFGISLNVSVSHNWYRLVCANFQMMSSSSHSPLWLLLYGHVP